MITAHELRIGNYVFLPDEIIHQIKEGSELDAIKLYEGRDYYKGIPLTEERLLQFWFKPYGSYTVTNSKFINIGRNRQLTIGDVGTPNEMIFLQEIGKDVHGRDKVEDIICLRNFDYDGRTYVHQLQNLYFALTGTELTLKP